METNLAIEDDEASAFLPVQKLTKDLKLAATTLTLDEARFLVDGYYMMQSQRIRAANQVRSLSESAEPTAVLSWFFGQNRVLEGSVRAALDSFSNSKPLGRWARSICGIGPVISAGLLAHLDVTKPTVGHLWRFAGLDPTVTWGKGQKRPWNASLKTLCWKIGESFVKVKSRESDVYGAMYETYKKRIEAENLDHKFTDAAAVGAARVGKTTEAHKHYVQGFLPPGHIHARAKRFAVKMFLSHYFAVGHFIEMGRVPPLPYPIAILGHAHLVGPPNMELVPGMKEAWDSQSKR